MVEVLTTKNVNISDDLLVTLATVVIEWYLSMTKFLVLS
jgi:hypothetical protein